MKDQKHYLGIDLSTQGIKAVIINKDLEVIAKENVHFDSELPEYKTQGGVHISGSRVTVPPIMWVQALDILLHKLVMSGIDFSAVEGITGCAQQLGSVYWKRGIQKVLKNLRPDQTIHEQLKGAFSLLDSPIWMDTSASEECRILENAVGGADKMAEITGSKAYSRFTGNQIAKFRRTSPKAYKNTGRISLVSSFAASLFLGDISPIEWADAGGMNILDIKSRTWHPELLDVIGPGLSTKLGEPVFGSTMVGCVSPYMRERYGFKENCQIVAFTGDNPASLAGLALGKNDVGITLGTSDTLFVWMKNPLPKLQKLQNVWVAPNPVDKLDYMALLSYTNGSLTRERIRDRVAGGKWELFNQLLGSTPRGNYGNIGLYFDHPEMIPHGLEGDFRFNQMDQHVERFDDGIEVRALIEGQFVAKRIHYENMGFVVSEDTRIIVTGGGSANEAILQVISDIFNAPVYTQADSNSAALGGAYRALHSSRGGERYMSYLEMMEPVREAAQLVCLPSGDAAKVYTQLVERFTTLLEARVDNLSQLKKSKSVDEKTPLIKG